MTTYAKDVVEHIFSFLPSYDLVTVSGGADGVDMLCHQLSLQYNIPTIVVL
jgi:predicted Rossmann fold nucleotide-binding protein DprA/Smf involved in DNA uptake